MKIENMGINNSVYGIPKESTAFKVVFYGNDSSLEFGDAVIFSKCNIYIHNNAKVKIGSSRNFVAGWRVP
jgi:hypothetical protein